MNGKQEKLELGDVGEIELPSIDVTPYVGRKVKVEAVSIEESANGKYVKMTASAVDTVKLSGGDDVILRPSRVFGLHQDGAGKWGWSPQTKLGVFLKRKGVSKLADIIGCEVVVQLRVSEKDGKEYLTFE